MHLSGQCSSWSQHSESVLGCCGVLLVLFLLAGGCCVWVASVRFPEAFRTSNWLPCVAGVLLVVLALFLVCGCVRLVSSGQSNADSAYVPQSTSWSVLWPWIDLTELSFQVHMCPASNGPKQVNGSNGKPISMPWCDCDSQS